jgi:colanic acid biosynthesis glycosyl transferase WcaI
MQKPKILIHSIAFSPDGVSTAYLYNDLALKFQQENFDVVVLTTTPHYNVIESQLIKQPLKPRFLGLFYLSSFNGIKVIHIPQKKFKNSVLRIFGFAYWHLLAFFLGIFETNIKLILSPSPPLTIGVINILIARLKKAKIIYNVQEIYPDFLMNQGTLKSRLIIGFLKSVEKFVYNNSDAVTTIDKVFYETIVNRFKDKTKLKLIPNFVDTNLYKPIVLHEDFYSVNFPKKNDVLKIMYAGNIGHAQDWEPLLSIAKELLHKKVEFWIIGEGVIKGYLEQQITKLGLCNIHLIPYQEREQMPLLVAYADLHFIFMTPKMDGQGFPSKVYTIMACAKPLLVISGENTPIFKFLKPINCAYLIDEEESKNKTIKLLNVIDSFITDKTKLTKLGNSGFLHIKEKYTKEIVTSKYVHLIKELIYH